MTTEKFRLTRTPLDATCRIFDAIPVGKEQWTIVETTSGSWKGRRESTGDGPDRKKERAREAERMQEAGKTEQVPRKGEVETCNAKGVSSNFYIPSTLNIQQ